MNTMIRGKKQESKSRFDFNKLLKTQILKNIILVLGNKTNKQSILNIDLYRLGFILNMNNHVWSLLIFFNTNP